MPLDPNILEFADRIAGTVVSERRPTQKKRVPLDPEVMRFTNQLFARQQRVAHARSELAESYLPGVKAYAAEAGADIVSPIARILGQGAYADRMNRFAESVEQAAREREAGGVVPDIIQRGARGAARSLTSMVGAGMVGGPVAAIGTAAVQEGNRAITEGRDKGLRGSKLAGYTVAQGTIEAMPALVMHRLGMGGLESMVAGKKAVSAGVQEGAKRVGKAFAQELPEELITELSHNVASAVAGTDPNALSLESLKATAADTTVQTLMATLMGGAPTILKSAEAKRTARHAREIMDAAAEGKVPSRKQWRWWGLSPKTGETAKARQSEARRMAAYLGETEQRVALLNREAPTDAQWRRWGLPEEVKSEARQEYLQGKFKERAEERARRVAEAAEAEAAQEAGRGAEAATVAPGEPAGAPRAGRTTYPSRTEVPVVKEGTGERIGAREVVRRLSKLWGVPTRYGRLGESSSKVRGKYKVFPGVARYPKGEEASISVFTHETAHHLDFTEGVMRKAMKGLPYYAIEELSALDYQPELARPYEGFAEWMRSYLTDATIPGRAPIEASGGKAPSEFAAPAFSEWFQGYLEKNPEIAEKIQQSRDLIDSWREAGAVGRVKGQISKTGVDRPEVKAPLRERVQHIKEFLYTRLKNAARPIKRFTEAAEKAGYVPHPSVDPYQAYSALLQTGPHFAANAIENGVYSLITMKKIGPALQEVLEEIDEGQDRENFTAWAFARHAVESWEKGKNPGPTLEDAKEAVRQLGNPRYERAADRLTEFHNALIDMVAETGAIGDHEAERIKEYYKTYIPLYRAKPSLLWRITGKPGVSKPNMVNLGAPLKQRRGSGLQIIDPIEATVMKTTALYERAAQQIVVERLVGVARTIQGLGEWVEKVPPNIAAQKFTYGDIKKQLRQLFGDELPEADEAEIDGLLDVVSPASALVVFRPERFSIGDEPIMRLSKVVTDKKGAERQIDEYYQLHPELHEALGGLGSWHGLGPVTRVAAAATRVLKIGATRVNPDFVLTNAFRDFQTFLIQGERGLRGAFDPAAYAVSYINSELRRASGAAQDPLVQLWNTMGGPLGTYVGLDRARLQTSAVRAARGKQSWLTTGLNVAGTPEVASRLAEFAQVLHREGWLDRVKAGETPPMDVLIPAINASHDVTVDFRRMGKWGRYINYYLPFFNAQLEGLDKTVRTFKDYPMRTTMRIATNRLPLVLLYWWYRHDDDDYKERATWLDRYWVFNDNEGNPIARIPKPHEWGLIDSGVERLLDAMYDKEPGAMKRWFKEVLTVTIPNQYPSGVTPIFENMFNYDSFRKRPIVSETLQRFEGPLQFYEHTTKIARFAAQFLYHYSNGKVNLSPVKIDHLADGLVGGLYSDVARAAELPARVVRGDDVKAADIPGLKGVTLRKDYTKSVDDFYELREKVSKRHESNKLRIERGENPLPEDENRWRRLENVADLMSGLRKFGKEVGTDAERKIDLAITGLARAALDRSPLERYPNPLMEPGFLPPEAQKIVADHLGVKGSTASTPLRGREGRLKVESIERADQSVHYLKDMGVTPTSAGAALYMRLRDQGVSQETARKRVRRLRLRLQSPGD